MLHIRRFCIILFMIKDLQRDIKQVGKLRELI